MAERWKVKNVCGKMVISPEGTGVFQK